MALNLLRLGRFGFGKLTPTTLQPQIRHGGIFTKYREPPNGFLFNRKPLKPGEKREWEDWEDIWVIGMGSALVFLIVGSYFRPSDGVLVWARKEAEIRVAEIDAAEAAAAAAAAASSSSGGTVIANEE